MLLHERAGARGKDPQKRKARVAGLSVLLPAGNGASEPGAGDASPCVDADAQGSRVGCARFGVGTVDTESGVSADAAARRCAEDRRAELQPDAIAGTGDGGGIVLDRAVPNLGRGPQGKDHAEA